MMGVCAEYDSALMLGARAQYDEEISSSTSTNDDERDAFMLGLTTEESSPSTPTIKTDTTLDHATLGTTRLDVHVTFDVGHNQYSAENDCSTYVATMPGATTESEEVDDGAEEGLRRYNAMIATLGYGPGCYEDSTIGGNATYDDSHPSINTTGMNTDAAVFDPTTETRGDLLLKN